MNEIISDLKNIKDFFLENNKRFYIPEFQREFVWDEDIVSQLMNDFAEDSNNYTTKDDDLSGYLLGNIVLIKDNQNNQFHVVDGQQRSISLSLLAKVLNDRLMEVSKKYIDNNKEYLKWLQLTAGLESLYLIKKDYDNGTEYFENRIKVNDFLSYGLFYSELIRTDTEDIEELQAQTKSEDNILTVYNSFLYEVRELDDKQLEKFTRYISNKVKLIVTVAPSEDKAFQLFEVLNDRGKSLEPLDLIKNIFLKNLYLQTKDNTERINFNNNWQSFKENLELTKKRTIPSSTFLKHYILANKGKNVKKNNLYSYVKKEKLTKKEILILAEDLKWVSYIYSDIEKKKYDYFVEKTTGRVNDQEKTELKKQMKILFEVLGIKQFHSLLIPFYFKDYKTKNILLDSAIKYGAAVMFAQRQTNIVEGELESLLREYNNDNNFEKLLQNISNKKERFVNEFRNNLYSLSIGARKKKAISLLKFIEIYGNNSEAALKANKTGPNSITLEHILPQTPSGEVSDLFEDANEYKRYVNYLGNLTLLKPADNSSLKNKKYNEKISTYEQSEYYLTNTLINKVPNTKVGGKDYEKIEYINEWNPQYVTTDKKEWGKEEIMKRGKHLTKYIIELLK